MPELGTFLSSLSVRRADSKRFLVKAQKILKWDVVSAMERVHGWVICPRKESHVARFIWKPMAFHPFVRNNWCNILATNPE